MRRGAALVMLAACGRLAFDPRVSGGDGNPGGDGTRNSDAPPDAPCTWGPFSAPVQLPAVVQSTSDDWSPAPALAATVVYFHSFRAATNAQLFSAQLLPTPQAAVHANELDVGTSNVSNPSLPDDGLEIFYDSDLGGMRKIYTATRTSTTQAFGTPALIASLEVAGVDDQNPTLTADGLRIVFCSSRGGITTLWEASRPDRVSPFSTPVELTTLTVASNTGRLDRGATLTPDGLDIFFAAPPGGVGQDIFTAHRTAVNQPFGTPVHLPVLSSGLDDEYPKMSRDASTLWLSYDSANASGQNAQLWMATRSCN